MDEFDEHNPDVWKWGIFYYNPNDPETISNRVGKGRASPVLNFARFQAWLYIALIIAAIVIYIELTK